MVLLAAAALLVPAYFILTSERFTVWATERVLGQVDERIAGGVAAGPISVEDGALVIDDLVLTTPEGERVAQVRRVTLELDRLALLRLRVHVPRLDLLQPELFLARREQQWNLERALAPTEPEEERRDLPLEIAYRFSRAIVRVELPAARSAEWVAWEFSGSGRAARDPERSTIDLTLDGSGRLGRVGLPTRVVASLHREGELGRGALELEGQGLAVEAVGALGPEQLRVDLRRFALSPEAARALDERYPLAVPVRAEGAFARRGREVAVDVRAEAGSARLALHGAVDPTERSVDDLSLRLDGADLRELLGRGPRSRISLRAFADGRGPSLDELSGRASIQLDRSRVGLHTWGPATAEVRAEDGRVELEQLEALLPGAQLLARGSFSPEQVRLEAVAVASDLSRVNPVLESLPGWRWGGLGGSGRFQLTASGPPENPSVLLRGQLSRLRIGEQGISALSIAVSMPELRNPLGATASFQAERVELDGRRLSSAQLWADLRGPRLHARASVVGEEALGLTLTGVRTEAGARVDALNVQVTTGAALDSARAERTHRSSRTDTPTVPNESSARTERTHRSSRTDMPAVPDENSARAERTHRSGRAESSPRSPERDDGLERTTWTLAAPFRVEREDDALVASPIVLVSEAGEVRLAGSIAADRFDVSGSARALELGRLPLRLVGRVPPLEGKLWAEVEAEGPWASPDAQGTFRLEAERVGGFRAVQVQAAGAYSQRRARGEVHVDSPAVTGSLRFDLPFPLSARSREPLRLEGQLRTQSLGELARATGLSGVERGTGRADLTLRGSAAAPDLQLELRSSGIQFTGGTLPVEVSLSARSRPQRSVLRARARAGGATARLDANVEAGPRALLGGVSRAALERAGLSVSARLERLQLQNVFGRRLGGTLSGRFDARGTLGQPMGQGELRLTGGRLGRIDQLTGRLELRADEERIRSVLRITQRGQPLLSAQGSIGASPAMLLGEGVAQVPLRLEGTLGPLERRWWAAFTGRDLEREVGTVRGEFRGSGTLGDPHLVFRAQLVEVATGAGPLRGELRAEYRDELLRLSGALFARRTRALRMEGQARVDLSWPEGLSPAWMRAPIQARLEAGAFELEPLAALLPAVSDLRGVLTAEARLAGTLGDPRFFGEVAWRNGLLVVPGYGGYRDLQLRAQAVGERGFRVELSARSNEGTLRLATDGEVRGGVLQLTGTAALRQFALTRQFQPVGDLTADARLRGRAARGQVRVEIDVRRARLQLPEYAPLELQQLAPAEGIRVMGKERPPPPIPAVPPRLARRPEPPELVVDIRAAQPLVVRGPDVEAVLRIPWRLRLTYDGELALAYGQIVFVEGTLQVLGVELAVLEDSRLRFVGPLKVPYLEVRAQESVRGEQVPLAVTLTGRGDELVVRSVEGSPISLAAFYTRLATGEPVLGGGPGIPPRQPATFVGALAATFAERILASQAPLALLQLEAGEAMARSSVEARTYVTDRVYLGYSERLGADPARTENRAVVRLNLGLTPSTSLQARYGDADVGGVDLFWSTE